MYYVRITNKKERSKAMKTRTSEKAKKIISVLKETLPKLSKEKQEYLLGLAEGMEMARGIAEDKERSRK
jgi:hypothetical protein